MRPDLSPFSQPLVSPGMLSLSTLTRAAACGLMGIVAGSCVACSGDTTGAAPSGTAYLALVLNERAINMSLTAPANTIQLTATALGTDGRPLPTGGTVTYRVTDSSVTVTPTGLVTARYVTPPSIELNGVLASGELVIASLQYNGVTHADTAFIRVTATAPTVPLATFSLQPAVGDSAVAAVGDLPALRVVATDGAGAPVAFSNDTGTDNVLWLGSSNQHVAFPYPRATGLSSIQSVDTGHVTFYASAWVYGVSVRDSLPYLVRWPAAQAIIINATPDQWVNAATKFVRVGGVVTWVCPCFGGSVYTPDSLDIVFDHPEQVDSATSVFNGFLTVPYSGQGNLHFPGGGINALARSFPVAGTYRYHNRADPTEMGIIFAVEDPKQ